MRTELVISTYNSPAALRLCLASVLRQDTLPDGICIADDGSGPETAAVVAKVTVEASVPVRHVWHEDRGFEKGAILNRAIASSAADHLVFIDGDVLVARGFLARHRSLARRRCFVSGSLIRLSMAATASVTAGMVADGTVFDRQWLRRAGALAGLSSWLKTAPLPLPVLDALERALPVRRTLMGSNASAFRDDLVAVNGYDERIKYGGQDKDLGERMKLAGMAGRHARFSAVAVHLDHPRGYDRPEVRARNRQIRAETRALRRAVTPFGIVKAVGPG